MEIGNLRHRIKFIWPLVGRDPDNGAVINTEVTSDELWALVEFQEVGSDERLAADQITAMTAAKITLRHRDGITTNMEVVFDGLRYKILSVLPDPKKCFLKLETVQVGAYREQSVVQQDGQTLTDANGNALTLGNSDQDDNYRPPSLTFTDSEGGSFTPE